MGKDPCMNCCKGCFGMLLETVLGISAFFAIIAATILPLIVA